MIRAKHHFIIYPFFKLFSVWMIRKKFNQVHLLGQWDAENEQRNPILIFSNHVGWWDGFWIMYSNQKVFKKKLYVMMLEQQLRKYWYFRYAGGYSILKHSKGALESIQYSADILNDPNHAVLIFPQGKFISLYDSQIIFQKGISRLLNLIDEQVCIVFVANFVEYFARPKPSLYIHFETYKGSNSDGVSVAAAYQTFYDSARNKQKQEEKKWNI